MALIFLRFCSIGRYVCKIERRAFGLGASEVDGAELGLVLGDIVVEDVEQPLAVLRRHHDAVADLHLGHAGHAGREVEDEFTSGMSHDHEVGIAAPCNIGPDFDAELLFLFVVHKNQFEPDTGMMR